MVDILTLVAVALGQVFGFLKRGLEGFGFGPGLVDLVGNSVFFAYLLRVGIVFIA